MNSKSKNPIKLSLLAAALLFASPTLFAQSGSTSGGSANDLENGKDKTPTNYENTVNMASPHETDAYKSFSAIPDSNFEKKTKSGEDFLHKYPNSAYAPEVYSTLSVLYIQNKQPDKGYADGEKAIELKPNDVRTMANLSQAMARLNSPNDPNAAQKLQKAEDYAKKAIQLTPTLLKPKEVSDQDFAAISNQTLAEAHSALGLINVRRANYDAAIPDLQEAAKLDGGKDITNYYLLGVAYANSSHYNEAVEAFNKCAASPGTLQQPCQNGSSEAQKHVTSK
jgi:tetratricopeptide (TPR) repeat protein